MSIIIKDRTPLISFILTDYGKKQLSLGKLSFDFYAFGDSDIDYRTADINSCILKPTAAISDLKTLLYKKDQSCFHTITDEHIISEDLIENQQYKFINVSNNNHIITIDNKFIGIKGEIKNTESPYILNVIFDDNTNYKDIKPLDFITIFLSDEFKYIENMSYIIYHCQIENILFTDKAAKIYLKQPINQNLTEYQFFITSSDLLFSDTQSWNQIFCGNSQLPNHENRFDGVRNYFNAYDGLLIYHNNQINPSDFTETATGSANLYIPTIMWDKNPINKMGIKLHTDNIIDSITSPVNQYFQINRISLNDEHNNRVGCYFPQHKMFFIDDFELATTMASKNGRNWTLPEINYEYIPSNGNGIFNKTDEDLYITYRLKGGVHNNTAYCRKVLFIPNRKGDFQLNLDFSNFNLPLLADPNKKIDEVSILFQFVPSGGQINPSAWREVTMLKGENLTINNIRGKYGLNILHLNRGISYQNDTPNNLDEQLFLGDVEYITQTKKYKTTFNFSTDTNRTMYTSNPTYINGKDIRVSEVVVYDKKYKPVALAKLSHSIRWRPDIFFTIKTQMIF